MTYRNVKIHGVQDADLLDEIMELIDGPEQDPDVLDLIRPNQLVIPKSRKWPAESE
jgi:hypothetical protein